MSEFPDSQQLFEYVATIFAVTVLLDDRERDPELIEFVHACMVHNHRLRPGVILSRQHLLKWFDANKEAIRARLHADDAEAYKTDLLSRIFDEDLQRGVLSSIFAISVADYELHDEETDFISRALAVWHTTMPTPEEVDAVA